jgi:hypothetical protein
MSEEDLKQQVLLELFRSDWDSVSHLKEVLRYNSKVTLQSLDADGKAVAYDPSKLLLHSLKLTVTGVARANGES